MIQTYTHIQNHRSYTLTRLKLKHTKQQQQQQNSGRDGLNEGRKYNVCIFYNVKSEKKEGKGESGTKIDEREKWITTYTETHLYNLD